MRATLFFILCCLAATIAAQGVPNNVGAERNNNSRQMMDYATCMLNQPGTNLPADNMAYCSRLVGIPENAASRALNDLSIDRMNQRNSVVQCYNPWRDNEVRSFKGQCAPGWYPLR